MLVKVRLVGEKAAREGLPVELGGRICPELLVEIGVMPRRELCLPPFHTEFCVLVLLAPDATVGLLGDSFGEEPGGLFIWNALTWRMVLDGYRS